MSPSFQGVGAGSRLLTSSPVLLFLLNLLTSLTAKALDGIYI